MSTSGRQLQEHLLHDHEALDDQDNGSLQTVGEAPRTSIDIKRELAPTYEVQWDNHYKTLQENPNSFKFNHVVTIKKDTECIVVHNEDHEPTKFMLYCPKLYYNLVQKTFGDETVFKKHEISPTALHEKFKDLCPAALCKKATFSPNPRNNRQRPDR